MEPFARDLGGNRVSVAFRCAACSGQLRFISEDALQCQSCGASWPVRDGIPRFLDAAHAGEEDANLVDKDFLRQASLKGWRTAVLNRFSTDRDSQILLTDWQRASWLPLLGLDQNSVALDVACGYGAITNSLARAAGQVFSLEAIPELIEFARIRMSQEGFSNVNLVQASVLDPPFADQMFDLVVVNGVLERVGEWDHQGNPRDVQVGFLRRLGRILKPEGTLLIGIDNRFGYHGPSGQIDHSGLSYTNLMPRRVASWWLRRFTRPHKRADLHTEHEYRTYTYGARGYQKLLADSSFPATTMYWPDPGHNQPYSLIPLDDTLIADRVDTLLSEPTMPLRYGPVQVAKRMLARSGGLRFAVPSFVILGGKAAIPQRPRFWQALRSRLPELPDLRAPKFSFYSSSFGRKAVIRVFEDGATQPACVVKTTTPAPGAASSLDLEYQCMQIVHERFGGRKDISFSVPRPLGSTRLGSFAYLAESVAPGLALSRVVFPATGAKRFEILKKVLSLCVVAAVQISQGLGPEERVARVDPSWLSPPEEIASDPNALAKLRDLLARCPADSVQHGDFTLENVFFDPPRRLAIIDWEHMFRGGSVLHDIFALFISLILGERPAGPAAGVPGLAQFEEALFGSGHWALPFRESIQRACRALAVPERDALPMLIHFLLLRINQLKSRNSGLAAPHAAYLAAAVRKADHFVVRA